MLVKSTSENLESEKFMDFIKILRHILKIADSL